MQYVRANNDGTVQVLPPRCNHCKAVPEEVTIPGDGWYKYGIKGELIQVAFPTLNASERELLQTGTHAQCWDEMFPDEEDEDDDE